MRHGRLIHAPGRQCVVHIGNCYDSSAQRNLFPFEPERIAGSVPSFMMLQRDIQGHHQEAGLRVSLRRGAESLATDQRVLLHDLEFIMRQFAGLEQN